MTTIDLGGPSSFWRFNFRIIHHYFFATIIIMSAIIRPTVAFNLLRPQNIINPMRRVPLQQQRCNIHILCDVRQPPSSMVTTTIIRSEKRTSSIKHRRSSSTSTIIMHNSNTEEDDDDEEEYTLTLNIPTPDDMEDIGALLSVNSYAGDIILLDGDLGAGKTCFSRGFIRARIGSMNERVTSPTYLLSNTYTANNNNANHGDTSEEEEEDDTTNVYHMDLYRLSGQTNDELSTNLNLENVFTNHISLIEWPSRLRTKPEVRLDVTLTIDPTIIQHKQQYDGSDEEEEDEDSLIDYETKNRCMKLVPHGNRWVERLKFLEDEGYLEDLKYDLDIQ